MGLLTSRSHWLPALGPMNLTLPDLLSTSVPEEFSVGRKEGASVLMGRTMAAVLLDAGIDISGRAGRFRGGGSGIGRSTSRTDGVRVVVAGDVMAVVAPGLTDGKLRSPKSSNRPPLVGCHCPES